MSKGKSLVGKVEGDQEVLSRDEVLKLLSEMARKGSVSAAIALERCLRPGDPPDNFDDELDRLLREK
jgi:hypothetical protein